MACFEPLEGPLLVADQEGRLLPALQLNDWTAALNHSDQYDDDREHQ